MLRIILVLFTLSTFSFSVQAQETLSVAATMTGCTGELSLYKFNGSTFEVFATFSGEEGEYLLEVPATGHEFYYFGPGVTNLKPVILGAEGSVMLSQPCNSRRSSLTVRNSLINKGYNDLKQLFGQINQRGQQAIMTYRRSQQDPSLQEEANAQLAAVDAERLHLLDSLRTNHPFLARIAALNTYVSYPLNGTEDYPDEMTYFAREFFQHVDWTDEGFHDLPWVYEAFKGYTATLIQSNMAKERYESLVSQTLDEIPQKSGAEQMAISGILATLKQKHHPSFVFFAERYIDHFENTNPAAVASLQQEVKQLASFMIGGEAPDFTQATPAGDDFSLHDLRGKVVLVDFWASWCGPCRRENPNVVRMYNEYREQGFEILGVSLDRDRNRWVQAIEQDGLEWLHVSDLQYWQNGAAKLYGVSSIPHTILLDAEGRIIARGLRGRQLEAKLQELFSEGD